MSDSTVLALFMLALALLELAVIAVQLATPDDPEVWDFFPTRTRPDWRASRRELMGQPS